MHSGPGILPAATSFTIPSGTYCSITVKNGTGTISGTYIITAGDFKVSGGSVTTAAAGATIYFPPSNTTGSLISSGGTTTLTAPTSGSLQGMALWKDSTTANNETLTGGNLTLNGIIYMPATTLTYTGGSTPVQQTIIVDKMKMTGGNISKAASSGFFSSGATPSGNFVVQ